MPAAKSPTEPTTRIVSAFLWDRYREHTDKDKATKFADRQRNSPVVKSARVAQVS